MSDKAMPTGKKYHLYDRKTQWHMAVTPAMKLEFMEYSQVLDYIPERLLNTNALQIDLLIIKKAEDIRIENEIGRIFQRHNIIEYKSPHDKEGINTYFKVHAYASLYKIGEKNTVYEPADITITMIRRGKPYKLFRWFARQGYNVKEMYKGVYYIENAGFFKTQVIVARELLEESHVWLTSLTDAMNRQQAENLIIKSRELSDKPEASYVDAVLQIVSKANRKLFEEIKREDRNMYSALVELMQPEIDEAVNKAVEKTWNEAVIETTNNITAQNKVEAIENAIKKLNMTEEEACAFMDTTKEQYDAYKQIIKNADNKKRKA
ncbi:MAG: hypothetical protein K2K74_17825 [Lachnospiraceae bacterium]|nr:hypothetical protein [Lachnospiraceae bacterium]